MLHVVEMGRGGRGEAGERGGLGGEHGVRRRQKTGEGGGPIEPEGGRGGATWRTPTLSRG